MRAIGWIALTVACGKKDDGASDTGEAPEADADTDADADADADADVDADADADTDAEPPPGDWARIRVLNLTAGAMSVFVDADARPKISVQPLSGTPWRKAGIGDHDYVVWTYNVQPTADAPSVPVTFEVDERYTATVLGPPEALVWTVRHDDTTGLAATDTRYLLTHAVVGAEPFDVVDLDAGTPVATGLAYGVVESVDLPPTERRLGVDLDRDGVAEQSYTVPASATGLLFPLQFALEADVMVLTAAGPSGRMYVIQPVPL